MSKPLQWVLGISILIVAVTVAGVGYCASWALEQWGEAAPNLTATVAKVNQTLDTINAPCSGDQPCRGTLGVLNKSIVKIGDAIVTTQLQERTTAPHVIAAMDTLTQSAAKLGGTADALTGTANALTGTARGATDTLQTANQTIAGAQPLLAAYTQSGVDLDVLLKDQAIHQTLVKMQGMATSADLMLADVQWKEHQLLHPDKVKLGFWGGVWAVGKYVHQFEPPIF